MCIRDSGPEFRGEFESAGKGMRGLDRRDDALGLAQQVKRRHRLGVRCRPVAGTTRLCEIGVFGTDTRIVEACRNRMRFDRLAVLVLELSLIHISEPTRPY